MFFTFTVVAVWWTLCLLSARMVADLVRKNEVDLDTGADWFFRQTYWLRWLSLALVVLCIGGFGFGRNSIDVHDGMFVQATKLLLPAVAMLGGLWLSEHRFGVHLGWSKNGIRAGLSHLFSSARISVGWLILPVLTLLGILDLVAIAERAGFEIPTGILVCGGAVLAIGFSLIGLPIVIRIFFPSEPVEDALEGWLREITDATGLHRCQIACWNTQGRCFNAMIVGAMGRFRLMLLSDRLLKELSRQSLAMVVLHEIAHAKRFHVAIRMIAVFGAWSLGLVSQLFLESIIPELESWSAALGTGVSLGSTFLTLRIVSHWIEFDADRTACQLAARISSSIARHFSPSANSPKPHSCTEIPVSEIEARRVLARALRQVTEESPQSANRSWLHPSIQDRVTRLEDFRATSRSLAHPGAGT
ncbi:MAG: M48 family metalloprotease [Planctomycetota bacterium]